MDESNVGRLREMSFVFLCLDRGTDKKHIVAKLTEFGVPFVDVGMGVQLVGDSMLDGILRVTVGTPAKHDHLDKRIPFTGGTPEDEYASNIQIADLNALNAALAVIKWKKLFGFYADLELEHFSAYAIDGNHIVNEDQT
jgi:hypothetical protein